MKPVNRNLLVEIEKEELKETSSTFLLPEDYKKKAVERYSTVKILSIADDCKTVSPRDIYSRCVVETTMINEIKVDGEVHNIIAENYVVLMLGEL